MQETAQLNNLLQGLFKLSQKVTLFVPTQDATGKVLDMARVEELQKAVAADMARVAGGATVTKGLGSWMGEHGLVQEEVYLVASNCNNLLEVVQVAKTWAERLKAELHQEAVALEINGELYLV